jgi:hypothetical protein
MRQIPERSIRMTLDADPVPAAAATIRDLVGDRKSSPVPVGSKVEVAADSNTEHWVGVVRAAVGYPPYEELGSM